MKLGFVTSILQDYDFGRVIDFASRQGFDCMEVACWPRGKAERRYAGVTHINTEELDDAKIAAIKQLCADKKVSISSLGFYPNTLDPDPEKRQENVDHLLNVIDASKALDVNLVTTFIGRDQTMNVEDNLMLVAEVWPRILQHAEAQKVRIGIENCPMLFDSNQWPGGQNIFTTPVLWRKIFDLLPSDYLGINYDPSHFVWQMIDYLAPIQEFKDKIFHVHIKDIKLFTNKLSECGSMAYPLDYMAPKLPGLGDVDWGAYINAIKAIGYQGPVCIEIEDKAYESCEQQVLDSIILSKKYIEQFIN